MKRYKQFTTAGAVLSIIGALVGCGNATTGRNNPNDMAHRSVTNTVKTTGNTTGSHTAPTNATQSSINQTGKNTTKTSGTSDNTETSTNSVYLTNIQMVCTRVGYATGYRNGMFTLWKTTNAGEHWRALTLANAPTNQSTQMGVIPVSASFQSENSGIVAWIIRNQAGTTENQAQSSRPPHNNLIVLGTTDGGQHWSKLSQSVVQVANYVVQINFYSKQDGWIRAFSGGVMNQGDMTIFHTIDGGQTWRMVSSARGYVPNKQATPHALPAMDVPMPMEFIGPRTGWVAVGNYVVSSTQATLYHTRNAGSTWEPVHLSISASLQNPAYMTTLSQPVFEALTGTVIVDFEGGSKSNHVIGYHTADGGATWAYGKSLAIGKARSVVQSFFNPNIGWILTRAGNVFAETHNGGQTWSTLPVSTALQQATREGFRVQTLDMVNVTNGWLVLQHVDPSTGKQSSELLHTLDGGKSWTRQPL